MTSGSPDFARDTPAIRMGPAPRVEAIPSASFLPREPETWEEAGLEIALVEQIVL
ncbi:MAG: hypothetical protein FJ090_15880, partial [Deltaproteobacteria bacterium]|nr:hypothetical protein [Deltaproteobacteria bacterium]